MTPTDGKHRVDLHSHTSNSFDSRTPVGMLLTAARAEGLRGIAITDHDHLTVVRSPSPDLLIVPGMELRIPDVDADLLAIGVTEPVPVGLPILDAIEAIHQRSGLAIVPHPFATKGRYPAIGDRIHEITHLIDGIEVTNPKSFIDNQRARRVAVAAGVARVGGSDAHTPEHIGSGYTVVEPVETVDDFLAAVRRRACDGVLAIPR